jgi:hypothetical protein
MSGAFSPWLIALLLSVTGLPIIAAPRPTTTATTTAPLDKTAASERKPSPSLASLPSPAATGPLRILLVDDDGSDNNNIPGDTRQSSSDLIFRRLVSQAVGGDASAWEIEHVPSNSDGPAFERLQPFSLVIWYTGSSYGGNPDNTAVLSIEDEKTVRRYLEEKGGTVVLVSPGYVSKVLDKASSWEDSSWPFLSEVMGIRGGLGLAQRFAPGTVISASGAQFQVGPGNGVVESQFSLIHPDGAAVVSSTRLAATKAGAAPSPVATAFAYGKGRMVYVGFTFENLASADLAPAFQDLIAATGLTTSSATPIANAPPLRNTVPATGVPPKAASLTAATPDPVEPTPAPAQDTSTAPATPTPAATPSSVVRSVKIRIYTGNDNKEALSKGTIRLYRNGGAVNDDGNPDFETINPNHLTPIGAGVTYLPDTELAVNSVFETKIGVTPDMTYGMRIESCQQYGLRLDIHYEPNFFLDAWRINRVELEIDFGYQDSVHQTKPDGGAKTVYFWRHAPGYPKVISFINGALLNNTNKDLSLITDGFFMPK